MSISISSFGALPDGRAAALYTLTNLKRCNSQNTIRFMSTFDN